jgi:hypothetical protein
MAKTQAITKKKKCNQQKKNQNRYKKGAANYLKTSYSHSQDFHSCYTEEAWEWMNSND